MASMSRAGLRDLALPGESAPLSGVLRAFSMPARRTSNCATATALVHLVARLLGDRRGSDRHQLAVARS